MKVSFDFDETLDRVDVQEYTRDLISRKIDVWIVTARTNDRESWSIDWNKDLYEVIKDLNISKDQIIFMAYADKYEFFENEDFIWHLDDSDIERELINEKTETIAIDVYDPEWKEKCDALLEIVR